MSKGFATMGHAIQKPAIRLSRIVEAEPVNLDGEWPLTEEPVLGLPAGDRKGARLVDASSSASTLTPTRVRSEIVR